MPEPEKKAEETLLTVTPSPHVFRRDGVPEIMLTVCLALLPAAIFSTWLFGSAIPRILLTCVASCVAFEWFFLRLFGNQGSLFDGSAAVTGLLLAFCLPPSAPWWLCVAGALTAMLLGKHIFGGLGQNPFNPALTARVFLLIAWPVEMTRFVNPRTMIDAETAATPLGALKTDGLKAILNADFSPLNCAIGNIGGSLGEMSALALLLGALVLLVRGYITWHIPAAFIGSLFLFTGVFWWIDPVRYAAPHFHLLTGGLVLGAFFMATDMVTSPVTPAGMLVFGIGCGVLTGLIRLFGGYPEGVAFAILLMNALTPTIDRYLRPKTFGARGRS